MKKLFYLLIALFAVACANNDEFENIVKTSTNAPETLYAAFEQPESRTYVEKEKSLRWTSGDEISYFPAITYNMQYRYTGESGTNNASFTKVTSDPVTGTALDCNYAVYPYVASTEISDESVISVELPAVQSYAVNSFGEGANTMVCATSGPSDAVLRFKNVGGYLKIKLYGKDIVVKNLSVRGNNGEKIAGAANITAINGQDPQVAMSESATETVTIDCGAGVALSANSAAPTAFWFVLPTVTFEDGFTITVTDVNGDTFEKTTKNSFTIERNMIQPMKALQATIEGETPAVPTPANNEIWYTATAKVEPYDKNVFGATYKSSEWDSATGKGVITFTSDITKVGNKAFYNKSLTSITLPESVTEIGVDAFFQCTTLTSVVLPQGLKSINGWAFQTCLKLTDITIPQSVTSIGYCAFSKCASLTNITIPENVTTIAGSIFSGCTKLKNITFSDMVTSIESSAFSGCSSLESITIPQSVTSVASDAFTGCTALPITDNIRYADSFLVEATNTNLSSYNIKEGTRFIGDNAFTNCQYLTGITIPEGVLSIGMNAFKGCSSLTSINIPEGVLSIGKNAFQNCSSLTSINIPESVTSIPIYFVYGCSALTSLTIPASVTSIDDYAFMGCSSLQTLYVESETAPKLKVDKDGDNSSLTTCLILVPENSVEQYKTASVWKNNKNYIYPYGNKTVVYTANSNPGYNTTNDFGGATISSNYWLDSNKVGIIIFDKDITTFGTLFKEKNITGVTLPKSVTSIGESAFYGCQALTSIDIPEGVETINKYAFSYCNTLGSIKLPSTLKSIGEQTFYTNCNSVWVYCKATTPPTLGTKAFNVNKSLSLFVPRTLLNVYESSEWVTTYSARINPYTF